MNAVVSIWNWSMVSIRKLYDWMGKQVTSPYGQWMLALFFFVEAIFFFPADPLLILFCVEKRNKAFYYATLATISSVLGGIVGYYIGYSVWHIVGERLITLISNKATFSYLCGQYKAYETWAVLVAGFTPIPYKLVTLTAGFCKLPLMPFVFYSFIARGARFYLVALVIRIWGKTIKDSIDRYFNYLVVIFGALVLLSILVLR